MGLANYRGWLENNMQFTFFFVCVSVHSRECSYLGVEDLVSWPLHLLSGHLVTSDQRTLGAGWRTTRAIYSFLCLCLYVCSLQKGFSL